MPEVSKACTDCPWRLANHGKRHPHGFYRLSNLKRLWNVLRRGGLPQSCHPTDPSHPDHGAKPGSKPRECAGSVILIIRELKVLGPTGMVEPEDVDAYLAKRGRKGLTKKGIMYWLVNRIVYAGKPLIGGVPLPHVDDGDPEIGLPECFAMEKK